MKKINFENAEIINPAKVTIEGIDYEVTPAQLTVIEKYLSAETLNEMQDNIEESCVAVSPTEPTTNEKVWIQKGKNLFNKNNAIKGFWVDSSNGNLVSAEDYNMVSEIISVLPNTKYTLSGISGVASGGTAWVTILSYSKEKTFNTMIFDNATLGTTFTTGGNDYYIRVAIGNISLTTVQLEQGSTATEYEAYIEEKIWVRNNNNVYVPFVPENKPINIRIGEEFETGRIIDNKKEYGKILSIGKVPSATSQVYATGITNLERYTYIDGHTTNAWGKKFVCEKINDSSIVLTQEGDNLKVQTWITNYADANYQGYIEIHYIKTT